MTTCVEVKNGEGLKVGWDTARRGKRGNVLSSGKCFLGKCLHGKCFLGKYIYGKCLYGNFIWEMFMNEVGDFFNGLYD